MSQNRSRTHPFSSCWTEAWTARQTRCRTSCRGLPLRSAPVPDLARTRQTGSFHSSSGWTLKTQQVEIIADASWFVLHHLFLMRSTFPKLFCDLLTCSFYFKGFPHFPETPRGCEYINCVQCWFDISESGTFFIYPLTKRHIFNKWHKMLWQQCILVSCGFKWENAPR